MVSVDPHDTSSGPPVPRRTSRPGTSATSGSSDESNRHIAETSIDNTGDNDSIYDVRYQPVNGLSRGNYRERPGGRNASPGTQTCVKERQRSEMSRHRRPGDTSALPFHFSPESVGQRPTLQVPVEATE